MHSLYHNEKGGMTMRKIMAIILVLGLLSGCAGMEAPLEPVLSLREALGKGSCSFTAVITADFGDKTYGFSLDCQGDSKGNIQFTVTAPESIAGISGKVEKGEGALTFDDKALAFDLLIDDQLSPISGPWILLKALRSGFVQSAGEAGDLIRVTLKDSYEADAFTVDVWLDGENRPVQGEIFWKDRRILTMEVKNFQIS